MSTWFDQPQSRFLVAAIITLSLSAVVIKWAGRMLREQLGNGGNRSPDEFRADMTVNVPPALVREALEKGLVTTGQLAAMSPVERQFLFASLGAKLGGGESARGTAAAREGPKVHCPGCGVPLEFPALPPLADTCRRCGTRSAIGEDEGGRYVLNVTRPKPL